MINFKYRPDIDGLRAIAVLSVVLFHAGFGFDGGFMGVDIFFVISGYLITGLIFKQQESDKFHLKEFWLRRIRRIAPASIMMTVFVLVFAGLVLLPIDYEAVGKAAYWHQLMGANIHFWNHSGYFDVDSEMHPLLHTWSLAVEEQFYLFYPFMLWFLRKKSYKTRFVSMWSLFGVSLIWSEWLVQFDSVSAFYLLPSRAWELLLGGLIWSFPTNRWKQSVKESGSLIALMVILGCCWGFPWGMKFPGVSAAIPCLATTLFIYSNVGELTKTGKLLATRPFVFVGLLSYSLYLWHWPVMVFARYQYPGLISPRVMTGLIAASFLLAYLSWRFVETPFRQQKVMTNTPKMLRLTLGIAILIISTAGLIDYTEGLPSRLSPQAADLFRSTQKNKHFKDVSIEEIENDLLPNYGAPDGTQSVLVWGDSHAMAIMPAVIEQCKLQGLRCYQITDSGHPPTFEGLENRKTPFQKDLYNRAAFNFALRNDVDQIIITGFWSLYSDSRNFESAMRDTFEEIRAADIPVTLVEDVATFRRTDTKTIVRLAWKGKDYSGVGITLEQHRKRNRENHRVFKSLESQGLKVYDPTNYFLDENNFWPLTENGSSLFCDYHHLSEFGNKKIKPLVKRMLDESSVNTAQSADRVIQ